MMLNVAICDDNPKMASQVESILLEYNPNLFNISIFYTPDKLIKNLIDVQFDFFILDIELPDQNGIELAKVIRVKNLNSPIIFLTSYREYMEDVFQVQTFDYIIKPASKEKFFPLIDKIIKYLNIESDYFSFSSNRIIHNIKLSDIIYFEKQRRNVIIHTGSKNYTTNMNTSSLINKINLDFIQTHNSYIINSRYIEELGTSFVILKHENMSVEIPISRKFKISAKDKLLMRLKDKL